MYYLSMKKMRACEFYLTYSTSFSTIIILISILDNNKVEAIYVNYKNN